MRQLFNGDVQSSRTGSELGAEQTLLQRCQAGDNAAFAELFAEYYTFAASIAAANTTLHDPGDVASEAFTRIWSAIRAGKGPTTSFKSYLAMAVKHVCYTWHRRRREVCVEDDALTALAPDLPDEPCDAAISAADCEMVAAVFASLPERWQTALMVVEVEGKSVTELATTLEISPNAASALCHRARAGLRASWDKASLGNTAYR